MVRSAHELRQAQRAAADAAAAQREAAAAEQARLADQLRTREAELAHATSEATRLGVPGR